MTNPWQAREVGEQRKRGLLVEIRRWRKHARRRKNAKPPSFEGGTPFARQRNFSNRSRICIRTRIVPPFAEAIRTHYNACFRLSFLSCRLYRSWNQMTMTILGAMTPSFGLKPLRYYDDDGYFPSKDTRKPQVSLSRRRSSSDIGMGKRKRRNAQFSRVRGCLFVAYTKPLMLVVC